MEPQTETSKFSGWFDKNNPIKFIFDNSGLPAIILNIENYEAVDINPELIRLLGYDAGFQNEDIREVIPDSKSLISDILNLFESAQSEEVNYKVPLFKKNNEPIEINFRIRKIESVDNNYLILVKADSEPAMFKNIDDLESLKKELSARLSLRTDEVSMSEERFSSILEELPFLIIVFDEGGKLLYVNSKWEELTGYSLLELSLNGLESKIMPDDLIKYSELKNDKNLSDIIRLIVKNGDAVDAAVTISDFELPKGNKATINILDLNIRNIPFLKKHQEELRNAKLKIDDLKSILELSNLVIEKSSEIILAYDNNGKLLRCSKESPFINQFSFYELTEIKSIPFISKQDISDILKFISEADDSESRRLEIKLIDKNNKEFFSLLNIKKSGQVTLLYFTDISNYKKEEVRQEASNCFFDDFPDMIILHEPSGIITDVNKLALEKLGFFKNELTNKNISEIGLQIEILRVESDEFDPASNLKLISRLKTKNGSELDVKTDSKIIDYNGKKIIMTVLRETSPIKQKQIESRLLESSLGQLLQFMNVGIIIFNQDGYITHISSNCETLTGIKSEEWSESSPFLVDKIVREDFIIFRQNIERVFKGEVLKDILIGFKNFEERKTELKGSFLPVMEEDAVSEVMLILQEYTKTDKERRSNNFYELILNNAPVGIITFDPDGNYTSVNEEFLKMLAYEFTREEVLQWNLYSLMDKDKILPGFVTALKGETVDYTRDYMPTPSNQKYSFYQSFAPLKDKDGSIIGVLGLLNEITDKSIIPQNIIEAEEKYHKIFDSIEDCILLFKPSGRILNANRGSFVVFGEPVTDIVKKNISDYFIDTESDEYVDFMFNLHSFGDSVMTTKIKREDGSVFEADVYGKGLEISGLQHFILVIKKHEVPLAVMESLSVSETGQREAVKESNGIDSFNFLNEFDEGIIITDSSITETIFINEKIKEMFNVSIDDFLSRGIIPLLAEKMSENSKYFFRKNIELCRTSQLGVKPFEVDFIDCDEIPDTQKVEVFNFTSKLLRRELKYIKFSSVKQVKFAEDEQDSMKSRFYKYFEYLPFPCVIINSDGVILDLNPPFNEALQYGYSDMIDKKLDSFFARDSERITSFLKLHKNFQHLNEQSDLRVTRRDGTLVDCRIFYTKIEDDIFLVFLHLTNVQRYFATLPSEREYEFKDRLATIQELTGEICMGFSSFAYLIDGYTEFLSKSRELSHPEKQRLNQLLALIERIHLFTEKLLVFSERKYLEQDKFDILLALKKISEESLEGFVNFKLSIPDDKIIIRGNYESVQNMFKDIFRFIRSSISGNGEISIEAICKCNPSDQNGLGIASENKFLLISIKERGFRIPGDLLHKIFEPFVASKDISKCDVGLAFSYGVIKSLGGSVSIEDDEEFDHRINLTIPVFN